MEENNNIDFDRISNRKDAIALLEKFKERESKLTLHHEVIGKNTIVACKDKEHISRFREQIKTNKITLKF